MVDYGEVFNLNGQVFVRGDDPSLENGVDEGANDDSGHHDDESHTECSSETLHGDEDEE